MNVVIAQIDVPYPCLCAIYRCTCGAEEARYGDESAVPPAGWLVEWTEAGDATVACAGCLSARRRPADALGSTPRTPLGGGDTPTAR